MPANEADVDAVRDHAWFGRMPEVLALVGNRWFSDAQLDAVRSALDDDYLPERERNQPAADISNWLWDYQCVRRG